jgi:hypothetical protein
MASRPFATVLAAFAVPAAVLVLLPDAAAQSARALDVRSAAVIEHWTPDRQAAAIPRDLVIDSRGLGYLRHPGNVLVPYGHTVAALASDQARPNAAPGGSSDTTGPSVTSMSPAAGATVGATAAFSAKVTDASGVKSVSVNVQKAGAAVQSFAATNGGADVWSVNLSGLTDGSWSWWIVARDSVKQGGGNGTTSPAVPFTVSVGGGGGGGGGGGDGTVANAEWTGGGVVQNAAGRLYFEMPANSRRTRWNGYVCSGTVVADSATGRSIILTASHCIYDDVNKAFARNVLFIPDQAGTTAAGTNLSCGDDPIGCWTPSFGVVDANWTTRTVPDNVHWDYAFYVVSDTGAHKSGIASASSTLDSAVAPMAVDFTAPDLSLTHGLGYSYDVDPQFMYCADVLASLNADNWWLGNCGLSGGSSGGPWVQPMDMGAGNGPIISVNSWGYTNQDGMAGPKLSGTSASCVFASAKASAFGNFADGNAGVKASCAQ